MTREEKLDVLHSAEYALYKALLMVDPTTPEGAKTFESIMWDIDFTETHIKALIEGKCDCTVEAPVISKNEKIEKLENTDEEPVEKCETAVEEPKTEAEEPKTETEEVKTETEEPKTETEEVKIETVMLTRQDVINHITAITAAHPEVKVKEIFVGMNPAYTNLTAIPEDRYAEVLHLVEKAAGV